MNNEEKILSVLQKHDAQFEKINANLEKHGEILQKHDAQFEKINANLEKHDAQFEKINEVLNYLVNEVRSLNLTVENEIRPNIQTLAEGQGVILEKLAALSPKSRVEALEDEMAFMKSVIKALSQEVAELKKAQ